LTLTNGVLIKCVADSSSAPEQGYFVESVILPLLTFQNPEMEMVLIQEHCTMGEQRSNAEYRYEIDLRAQKISFYEEHYNATKDTLKKGLELTGRYSLTSKR
jgi:hypothetical protein